MTKLRIFYREFGLSGLTQSPRKRPLESCYFIVKPLCDSIVLITAVNSEKCKQLTQKCKKITLERNKKPSFKTVNKLLRTQKAATSRKKVNFRY